MKREVKIGIFGVAMILCAWAGIRFLSGFDIFSRNIDYFAAYDRINGVQNASAVLIRGVKVGTVTDIRFDPKVSDQVVLKLTLQRKYALPADSEARIFSSSLMGSKAIEIVLGDSPQTLRSGDTLRTGHAADMMDMATSELEFLKERIVKLTDQLSATLENVNTILGDNAQNINGITAHVNSLTGQLDRLLSTEQNRLREAIEGISEFAAMMGRNSGAVDSLVGNLSDFSASLANSRLVERLDTTLAEVNTLLSKIDRGEGSVGQLLNDERLYNSLQEASANLSALLADLKANPRRYVHFSLFGSNDRKAAKKSYRDSVKQARRDARKAR